MAYKVSMEIGGRDLSIEFGDLAKQADGAVIVSYGETVVLVTAVAEKVPKEGGDFLPLTVDYREKPSGLVDLLKREDVIIEVKKVSFGDYVINDSITIERKTSRDFLISIIDFIL